MNPVPHNIYIHVPFCVAKCNYCAFWSVACANPDWDAYTAKICEEIRFWGERLSHCRVPTVFFGGGTPSLMPTSSFGQIIQTIKRCFDLAPNAEITLESNPGTINQQKLMEFFKLGVNRLSVGAQRLDDTQLKFMGRRHSVSDTYQLIHWAQDIGMRVSADFIYGIPGDTATDIKKMCHEINLLGLTHCSMYELTIEPDTPFGKMHLDMPDNDTMAQMYTTIAENLNLARYEVSNYATPGQECRHNQNIWDGDAYIGIGSGAAGRILLDGQWYEQMGNHAHYSPITDDTRAIEMLITGMRTVRGCRLTEHVKNVINQSWIESNPHLVQIINNRICPTDAGILVLDDIIVKMVR